MAAFQTLGTPAPVKPVTPPTATSGGTDYAGLLTQIQNASAPVDTKSILAQAHQTALANTSAITSGLVAQQNALEAQAAQRAQGVQQAGNAAANTLQSMNLGGKLAASYRQAGNDQAALASGFSGQLRQQVGNESAQANKALASLGAPGQANTNTTAAGNTVYALGGQIPANSLLAQAPHAVQNAQAGVRQAAGLGTEAAIATLGAGKQAAERLTPQIAAAESRLPADAAKIAQQLYTAAQKSRQDAIANAYKAVSLAQAGDRNAATAAYHQAETDARTAANQERAAHDAVTERVAQQNANTTQYRAHNPNRSPKVVGTDKTGRYVLNPDGTVSQLPGTLGKPVAAKPGTAKGSLSQKDVIGLVDGWANPPTKSERVPVVDSSGQPVTNANHVPQYVTKSVPAQPALSFVDATNGLVAHGVPRAAALTAVLANPTYAAQAQTQITQAAQLYAQNGTSMKDALKELGAYVPASLAAPVLRSAYAHQKALTRQARGLGLQGTAAIGGSGPAAAAKPNATRRSARIITSPQSLLPAPRPLLTPSPNLLGGR